MDYTMMSAPQRILAGYKKISDLDPHFAKEFFRTLGLKVRADEDEMDYAFMDLEYEELMSKFCDISISFSNRLDNFITSQPGVEVWILRDKAILRSNEIYKALEVGKIICPEHVEKSFNNFLDIAYHYLNNKFLYCSEYMEIHDTGYIDSNAAKIKIELHGGMDIGIMPFPIYYLMSFIYNLRSAVEVVENWEKEQSEGFFKAS